MTLKLHNILERLEYAEEENRHVTSGEINHGHTLLLLQLGHIEQYVTAGVLCLRLTPAGQFELQKANAAGAA